MKRPFLLIALLSLFVCSHAQPPLPPAQPTLLNWRTENTPAARRFRQELANSAAALAEARRGMGVLLDVNALEMGPVPPPDENAAQEYRELTKLLAAKPFEAEVSDVMRRMTSGKPISAQEEETVLRLLEARSNELALIDKATAKPRCNFERDWKQGFSLTFPEYATIGTAVYLNAARTRRALRDGKPQEALRFAKQNYAFSDAVNEPSIVSFLVSVQCEVRALLQFEAILRAKGDDSTVVKAVGSAAASYKSKRNANRALLAEAQMARMVFENLRNGTPQTWKELLGILETPDGVGNAKTAFSAEERQFLVSFADLAEAEYLKSFVRLLQREPLPSPSQPQPLEQSTRNPAQRLALGVLINDPTEKAAKGLSARKACLNAAVAVLLHRNERGEFPADLEQAMQKVPRDPYNQKALGYIRRANGFVVFSVGATGTFNGGTPERQPTTSDVFFQYP